MGSCAIAIKVWMEGVNIKWQETGKVSNSVRRWRLVLLSSAMIT